MYNEWCGNSKTCITLAQNSVQPDLVLVVDNSTKNMNNEACCAERGWLYHSMCGNAGLSKAYNAAIRLLDGQTDLVVWADDDTCFPENYFEKLREYARNDTKADVFLPVVRTQSFIMSPAIYTKRRVVPIRSVDELKGKEITGINSGLAVRLRVYQEFHYDEAIFLDCVDHDFLRWCRIHGKKFCVMNDLELVQSFFSEGKPSPAARKNRARIYTRDTRVFDAKCGKSRLLTQWDLLRYWIAVELSCLKNR